MDVATLTTSNTGFFIFFSLFGLFRKRGYRLLCCFVLSTNFAPCPGLADGNTSSVRYSHSVAKSCKKALTDRKHMVSCTHSQGAETGREAANNQREKRNDRTRQDQPQRCQPERKGSDQGRPDRC